LGAKLKDGYNNIVKELEMDYTRAVGYNFRSMVTFDERVGDPLELKSFVQQELIKRGILWSGTHNMSYSHTNSDVEYTLTAYQQVLFLLKDAVEKGTVLQQIKGIPVQPTFRKTSGFNTKPLLVR
jgi:glutamate-1-semialdehyde aminotransferase